MWFGGNANTVFNSNLISDYSGLTEWNQENDAFQYFLTGFQSGIRADHVNCLFIDTSNAWIGTENGLIQKDKRANYSTTFGIYSGLYSERVFALAFDGSRLFIGTENGLNYARRKDKDWEIQKVEIPELRRLAVFKILIHNNILWLGTDNGIYSIDQNEKHWNHYDANGYSVGATTLIREEVRGLAQDDSLIYFASSRTIIAYRKKESTWKSFALNSELLNSGINDAACDEKNLWIATNGGVLRLDKKKGKWYYYGTKDGLASDIAKCVLIDGDYVWFGTDKGVTQFFWNAKHLRE